jgi:signal transduction histidine kinase/ligand-binding sensor domain-containing protein
VNKQRTAVIVLGILLACCPRVSALNPALDISQYAHTPWKAGEGFSKGIIFSIAQTPDGYLWLGTEYGLLRFDGVRSVPWQPPAGQHLPNSEVQSLLVGRDGNLWIGTREGLASWKDGKLTQYAGLAGQFNALFEDREGTIWAGMWTVSTGRICAIQNGTVRCYGEDGRFGRGVYSLYEDSAGNLWLGAATGLWRWKPGPPQLYPIPDAALGGIYSLVEGDNGVLLMAMRAGIKRFVKPNSEVYPLPGARRRFTPYRMLRDRNGGLWIGTEEGALLHVHQGRTDVFGPSDGLTADFVEDLFEDREGNIWVATNEGLDLFRDYAVSTISSRQGLPGAAAVLPAKDGSVWVGSAQGLASLNNGQIRVYPLPGAQGANVGARPALQSLAQDNRGRIWAFTDREVAYFANDRLIPLIPRPGGVVYSSAADDAGNLWASDQNQGLIRLRGESVVERIPWARLGVRDVATALFPDPVQGGLWLGFLGGGVAYFKEGQVRASYAGAEGLGAGRVSGLQLDGDGTLWAATEGGLSRIRNGRVATLTNKNGLPCDVAKWVLEDDAGSCWLYMACGMVRIARSDLDRWVSDPGRSVPTTVFDVSDGVRSHAVTNGTTPRVAKAADGRLWFLSGGGGVSVVDPRRLPFNKVPPPVHIEEITADGKAYEVTRGLRLPPRVRNLEIRYTALSLTMPEKVRFRFRLEGQDPDWREVVNRRRVEYSNLPPGDFRFRVMASNNSGVWNDTGASLDFAIAPAYYQTRWFEALIAMAGLTLLWAAYQYRVRRIAHEFDLRLDERVNERTRVARELHDTLLQTFHGVLFRFQAAVNMLPERPAEAKQNFESAIERAAQAITEGRDAIQDLRASTVVTNDLAVAITTLGDELASSGPNGNGTVVDVAIQGTTRDLHPILRDDIYRIAGEALRNAFRHAQAHRIEVEITYDDRQFRLQVRDDGKGIDGAVLADERRGHFGLPGMRERAELVGGHLDLWSEVGAGTEVDLTIPAEKAYVAARARRRAWWFAKKTGAA